MSKRIMNQDGIKAGRTDFVLLRVYDAKKLPSEYELLRIINDALKEKGVNTLCSDVIMVRDQVLTLNVDLNDACKAIVEEHGEP